MTDAEAAIAWTAVSEELTRLVPDWNLMPDGRPNTDPPGPLARQAVYRLAMAAETEELGVMRVQIRQEMQVLRALLADTPAIPPLLDKELRSHLMRLARIA